MTIYVSPAGRLWSFLKWFLFSYQGRIGRLAFWAYYFGGIVVGMVFVLTVFIAFVEPPSSTADGPATTQWNHPWVIGAIVVLGNVALFWTSTAVCAKRWHDRDKSGWWSLIYLIPYAGTIWVLVECGFLKGTEGPNRFGEPRGGPQLLEVF